MTEVMPENSKILDLQKGFLDKDASDELDADYEDHFFIFGGFNGVDFLTTLDAYSPGKDLFKPLAPMSCIRTNTSVAKLNGEIYAVGGGNGYLWYDTVESYNPATDEWTPRPNLNIRKGNLAACTLNDKIYTVGGGNGYECFSDTLWLDLEGGRWIDVQWMNTERYALEAVALNGAIYAVGGYDGTLGAGYGYLSSVERFDPRENTWTKIGRMGQERGCFGMVVLNEKIYATGGLSNDRMQSSAEVFDPRVGVWMDVEPMSIERCHHTAVVLNGQIYAIGGIAPQQDIIDTIEVYEEGYGWQSAPNPFGRRAMAAAIAL